jgi:hypothetical protein
MASVNALQICAHATAKTNRSFENAVQITCELLRADRRELQRLFPNSSQCGASAGSCPGPRRGQGCARRTNQRKRRCCDRDSSGIEAQILQGERALVRLPSTHTARLYASSAANSTLRLEQPPIRHHCASDVATLRRLRLYRNSIPRGESSGRDGAMDRSPPAPASLGNLSTVLTRAPVVTSHLDQTRHLRAVGPLDEKVAPLASTAKESCGPSASSPRLNLVPSLSRGVHSI